jgi:hypothetical protein
MQYSAKALDSPPEEPSRRSWGSVAWPSHTSNTGPQLWVNSLIQTSCSDWAGWVIPKPGHTSTQSLQVPQLVLELVLVLLVLATWVVLPRSLPLLWPRSSMQGRNPSASTFASVSFCSGHA